MLAAGQSREPSPATVRGGYDVDVLVGGLGSRWDWGRASGDTIDGCAEHEMIHWAVH